MTLEERDALLSAVPPGVTLSWLPDADSHFVRLQAGPCPLLRMDGAVATCTVHAVRPYNCRRWGCFRDNCREPVDMSPVPVHVLTDKNLRSQYKKLQMRAQPWALRHGWSA